MNDYSLRPLHPAYPADHVPGVTTWCWQDHTGLRLSPTPPTTVPTGWAWGWGDDVWVRWRYDPFAPSVGAELRRGHAPDPYVPATTVLLTSPAPVVPGDTTVTVPSVVREPRFLSTGLDTPDPATLRGRPLTVIRVLAPTQLTFHALG